MTKLPTSLFDSHKRYKEDTKQVATWLVETAQKYGHPLNGMRTTPGTSGRLKGKARKQAREAAKASGAPPTCHTVTVKEFTNLANWISKLNPPVKVPRLILALIRSVIARRKRCADWFQKNGAEEDDAISNSTHSHFISVLESVLQMLEPNAEASTQDGTKSRDVDTGAKSEPILDKLTNKFDVLRIDNDHLDDSYPSTETEQKAASRPTPSILSKDIYDVETIEDDANFALFCLFEDLNELRNFLRGLWLRYKDQTLDLITVSVTTNVAISLVSHVEQDLLTTYPTLGSFDELAQKFHAMTRETDPRVQGRLDELAEHGTSNLDDWLFMPILTSLKTFCNIMHDDELPMKAPDISNLNCTLVETIEEGGSPLDASEIHITIHDGELPFINPPGGSDLHVAFGNTTDEGESPILEVPGASEVHIDWATLVHPLRNQIVLGNALMELSFMCDIDDPPVLDELTHGLISTDFCKTSLIWVVFAAQIFVDIHNVLGKDVGRGFSEMQATGTRMASVLNECYNWSLSNAPEGFQRAVRAAKDIIDRWVLGDALDQFKREEHGNSTSDMEPFSLFKCHPLLCGLLEFVMYSNFQLLGIHVTANWGSISYAAHLYEGCRQAGYLTESWPDMEQVMEIHTREQIFHGRIPRTPKEILKSISLMLGSSAVNYAPTSSLNNIKRSKKRSGLAPLSPITKMFYNYWSETRTRRFPLSAMEEFLNDPKYFASTSNSSAAREKGQTLLQRQWAKTHELTTLQLLDALHYALVAEKHMLCFDYVSFHFRCLPLFSSLRTFLDDIWHQCFGRNCIAKDSSLIAVIPTLFMLVAGRWDHRELLKLRLEFETPILEMASDILRQFIMREGSVERTRLQQTSICWQSHQALHSDSETKYDDSKSVKCQRDESARCQVATEGVATQVGNDQQPLEINCSQIM